jgi:LuxR family quorum sensing-dependent transcriptional regulator
MLLTETALELFANLDRQKDLPSLLQSFNRLVGNYGMRNFCIGNPAPRAKHELRRWPGTWPEGWSRRYASQEYFFHDPVVARLNAGAAPFRWADCLSSARGKGLRMIHEAREFGMKEGLAIPIHGLGGVAAAISIGSDQYGLSPQDERALHMASLYLHGRMVALQEETSPPALRRLTPRERECLKWIAAGKTDWEISLILNISEQTVHGYVQNALTKLNARTRAQAVALAMLSAQILQ